MLSLNFDLQGVIQCSEKNSVASDPQVGTKQPKKAPVKRGAPRVGHRQKRCVLPWLLDLSYMFIPTPSSPKSHKPHFAKKFTLPPVSLASVFFLSTAFITPVCPSEVPLSGKGPLQP